MSRNKVVFHNDLGKIHLKSPIYAKHPIYQISDLIGLEKIRITG